MNPVSKMTYPSPVTSLRTGMSPLSSQLPVCPCPMCTCPSHPSLCAPARSHPSTCALALAIPPRVHLSWPSLLVCTCPVPSLPVSPIPCHPTLCALALCRPSLCRHGLPAEGDLFPREWSEGDLGKRRLWRETTHCFEALAEEAIAGMGKGY